MMSMQNNSMHRMLPNNEDTRRLLYLSSLHRPSISGTSHRTQPDLSGNHTNHHSRPQTSVKRLGYQQATIQPTTTNAVSRRNARERKRVRLVNLGFSTLRERVPSGTKNKKLSKVETLRAAIEYIRQLQEVLGMPDQQTSYEDLERMMADENYGPDDCSSVASSEEVRGPSGGSGDLSPASSHPSECSLVASPYTSQHTHDDQLMDIGLWFS